MSIIIVVLTLLIPPIMLICAWPFTMCRALFHVLAVGCAYTFGIISALSVYEILRDETVFMTNIHAIFKNELFLLSGAYLGSYGIYLMLRCMLRELRSD